MYKIMCQLIENFLESRKNSIFFHILTRNLSNINVWYSTPTIAFKCEDSYLNNATEVKFAYVANSDTNNNLWFGLCKKSFVDYAKS